VKISYSLRPFGRIPPRDGQTDGDKDRHADMQTIANTANTWLCYLTCYDKGKSQTGDKLSVTPRHNPLLIKIGVSNGLPKMFLKFAFRDDRSSNFEAVDGGGQNFRSRV